MQPSCYIDPFVLSTVKMLKDIKRVKNNTFSSQTLRSYVLFYVPLHVESNRNK